MVDAPFQGGGKSVVTEVPIRGDNLGGGALDERRSEECCGEGDIEVALRCKDR